MVARARERGDGEMHRRHAARRANRADSAFQCRAALPERRWSDSRYAYRCDRRAQIEQRRCMVGILKDERAVW
jgi:hypothetical protein